MSSNENIAMLYFSVLWKLVNLGKVSRKKAAVLLDFVQITSHPPPPPSPQFGQLVQLFLNAKNVDLSDIQNVRWGEEDINIQTKKKFMFQ